MVVARGVAGPDSAIEVGGRFVQLSSILLLLVDSLLMGCILKVAGVRAGVAVMDSGVRILL